MSAHANGNHNGFKVKATWTFAIGPVDSPHTVIRKENLIVNNGIDALFDSLFKAASRPAVFNYMGVGTNADTPDPTDVSLGAEVTRVSTSYTHSAASRLGTIQGLFPAGVATGTITEAGLFNASSGGVMFNRVLIGPATKGVDDPMTVTVEVEVL